MCANSRTTPRRSVHYAGALCPECAHAALRGSFNYASDYALCTRRGAGVVAEYEYKIPGGLRGNSMKRIRAEETSVKEEEVLVFGIIRIRNG